MVNIINRGGGEGDYRKTRVGVMPTVASSASRRCASIQFAAAMAAVAAAAAAAASRADRLDTSIHRLYR